MRFLQNLVQVRGLDGWNNAERRRLVMLQYCSLLAVLNMAGFVLLYLLVGIRPFLMPILTTVACVPLYLLAWLLNRRGHHLGAKLTFCTVMTGSIFLATALFFGKSPGLHFFLLLAAVLPLLFWPLNRPFWILVIMGASLGGFLFVQLRTDESAILFRNFPAVWLPFFNCFSVVAVYAVSVIILAIFQRRSEADARGLEVKEERLRLAMEGLHDALWDLDLTTGVMYRSPSWWTMLGYSPSAGPETPEAIKGSIHPDDLALVTRESQKAINEGGNYRVEARMKKADGSWLWVETRGSVSATDAAGKAVRLSGMNSDIQNRKKAEQEKEQLLVQLQQAQKMEGLGKLAAGIAHDMNNVLGAILNLASGHRMSQPEGTPTAVVLDDIVKASKRGGNMVKSLLAVSRQNPLVLENFSMNELLTEETGFLEQTILAKTKFDLDLASDLKPIRGDRTALKNLFMNLFVNAVDAMPGPGVVTVQTRNKAGSSVEIRVVDRGKGMSPEILSKAMDPFFTTKPVGQGTGLGLAMAYATVKNHGGQLDILSSPGAGTTVSVILPATADLAPPEPAKAPSAKGDARLFKILLVDDDEIIRETTGKVLMMLGHTVETATTGEEGLRILGARTEINLVILDMTMPGLGGKGTLPLLKERYPGLPVILATGLADDVAVGLANRYTRTAILPKPYDVDELKAILISMGSTSD